MKRRIPSLLAVLLLVQGCARAGDGPGAVLAAEMLYGNNQCGVLDRPEVAWIASPDAWRRLYGQVTSLRMNPPPAPAVDFSREGVVLVGMGQRPSAGYGLSLAGDVTVQDGVLAVRVDWREPAPGHLQAQVVTSPCLLLKVPAVDFTHLRVMDREGRIRLEGGRSR